MAGLGGRGDHTGAERGQGQREGQPQSKSRAHPGRTNQYPGRSRSPIREVRVRGSETSRERGRRRRREGREGSERSAKRKREGKRRKRKDQATADLEGEERRVEQEEGQRQGGQEGQVSTPLTASRPKATDFLCQEGREWFRANNPGGLSAAQAARHLLIQITRHRGHLLILPHVDPAAPEKAGKCGAGPVPSPVVARRQQDDEEGAKRWQAPG